MVYDGEVDLASAPHIENCLTRAVDVGGRDVKIDLSSVTFIDLAGWEVVGTAAEVLTGRGDRLCVVALSRCVERLIGLIGLHEGIGLQLHRSDGAGATGSPPIRSRRQGCSSHGYEPAQTPVPSGSRPRPRWSYAEPLCEGRASSYIRVEAWNLTTAEHKGPLWPTTTCCCRHPILLHHNGWKQL